MTVKTKWSNRKRLTRRKWSHRKRLTRTPPDAFPSLPYLSITLPSLPYLPSCTSSGYLLSHAVLRNLVSHRSSYQVDIDLKKVVDESAIKASPADVKKAVRKIFEDRYLNQKDVKSEKKATGVKYFFDKLRF